MLTADSGETLGVKWATPDVTQTELDAEASTRASADTTEATTRAAADTTLQTNIDSEASTRAANDTTNYNAAIQRSNHTGTQLAATVSDFNTAVRTNRLDQMASPTSSLSFNSQKGTNVADPTDGGDAVNYETLLAAVSASAAGFAVKETVRVASTANITYDSVSALVIAGGGTLTIDGVLLATGDRVLLKDQTLGEQNGIWEYATSGSLFGGTGTFGGSGTFGDTGAGWSLTRTSDADESAEFPSMLVFVGNEGTANKRSSWLLTTTGTITVGTTSLTYSQFPIPAFGTPTATINAGDSASAGTATTAMRSDGQMAVATGAASSLFGAASEGSSTNLARADHDHPWGVPTTIATGETFTVPSSRQWDYGESITINGTGTLVVNGDLVDTSGPAVELSLPWTIDINPHVTAATQTNFNNQARGPDGVNERVFNAIRYSTGDANAEIGWDVVLAAGTWTFLVVVEKANDRGIITVSLDGSSIGTLDTYNATPLYNQEMTITGAAVAATGKKRLLLKMATKNPSSSSYFGLILAVGLRRTA